MYARLLTWWTILRICLEERLVYRGDFALGTLMRFLPFITQIFLWSAVFAARDQSPLRGYSYNEMIAYLLLTNISRAFSSMPGLASSIAQQIRNGEIKKFLIQPIDLIGFLLLARVAHKVVYYVVALAPFALVFYLARGFFSGWPDVTTMLAFLVSLVMAFLLGFFLEATIGMVGFWFLEVSSLLFVYQLFSFFLSGQMFPIDILPSAARAAVDLLPVPYLAYFPVAVFLGKVQGTALAWGLLVQAGWVVLFMVASRVALHRGLIRYSGFGG
ncbi:MAG: ABC-2 family transporter protein [Planctomycetia bacterium]|nr:ABC-2 family transporter protein [Planctomycetia bacterium]